MLKKTQGVGPIRKVVLVKEDHEGLGISITVRSLSILSFQSAAGHVWIKPYLSIEVLFSVHSPSEAKGFSSTKMMRSEHISVISGNEQDHLLQFFFFFW